MIQAVQHAPASLPRAPLCRALELHPDWRLAFDEPTALLYVRRGSVAHARATEAAQ